MKKTITYRSPYAKVLESNLFRRRILKAKKGKGSYNRNDFKKTA